jgi:hypothetical protein
MMQRTLTFNVLSTCTDRSGWGVCMAIRIDPAGEITTLVN